MGSRAQLRLTCLVVACAALANVARAQSVPAESVRAEADDPWAAPDVVIAVFPTHDAGAAARVEMVARALVEIFLVGRCVSLTRALTRAEVDAITFPPSGGLEGRYLECMRLGGDVEGCRDTLRLPDLPNLRVCDGVWPSDADALLASSAFGVESPAPVLEYAFSGGVARTQFVSIDDFPWLPWSLSYASSVRLDVGHGPSDVERVAALLLEACEVADGASCAMAGSGDLVEPTYLNDRVIVPHVDPSAPSGVRLQTLPVEMGWRVPPGDRAIVVRRAIDVPLSAPELEDRLAIDAGRSFYLHGHITQEQADAVEARALEIRAAVSGGHRARVERSGSYFTVHVAAIERPWHHLVRVWLESPGGAARSAVGQGEVDVVAVGPTLSLQAGREVCGSLPGPVEEPSGHLTVTDAMNGNGCLLQPWWSLEQRTHHLYAHERYNLSHVRVSVTPDPLYWVFVVLTFVGVILGVWATSYRPTAKWIAYRAMSSGGFRESAEHRWEVTELKTIRDGPIRVTVVGPLGWARPGPDAVLRDFPYVVAPPSPGSPSPAASGPQHGVTRTRLHPGVTVYVDGEVRAQIIDEETARNLRDGTLEDPPPMYGLGCGPALAWLGLAMVAPFVVWAPARFLPALWTMEATLRSTSLLAVIVVLVLAVTRWTARLA